MLPCDAVNITGIAVIEKQVVGSDRVTTFTVPEDT